MRIGGLEMCEERCCCDCQHFVGPIEEEEWDEDGTEGMCPHMGWYTDALDEACDEYIGYDY